MKVHKFQILKGEPLPLISVSEADLVLAFGSKELLSNHSIIDLISTAYPKAVRVYCSSAGEIHGTEVFDDTVTVTAMKFEKTPLRANNLSIQDYPDSFAAGAGLVKPLIASDLRHILVFSDGAMVNGSELVRGMLSVVPEGVTVAGGLAGDAARFESTLTGLNTYPSHGQIIAVGFYGDHIKMSHGSYGGWDSFGLEKTVTRSRANVLFEIDGQNVLESYKNYLGKYANELPGSALLFPLSVRLNDGGDVLVRTILSINEEDQSMIFAGDIPEGSKVRFMKANFDRLIDAASLAAKTSLTTLQEMSPKVAILISCVGRKLILGSRIDEEVEAVREILGQGTLITGFYSYGEISPVNESTKCELHNQTMTITCFEEI